MKKLVQTAILAALLAGCATQNAAQNAAPVSAQKTAPQTKNAEANYAFLSAPRFDSAKFDLDLNAYYAARALMNTPRGEQAAKDANISVFPELYSEAFGARISKTETPAIYALIKYAAKVVGKASKDMKNNPNAAFRARPFVLLNANTCAPQGEAKHAKTNSFPSSHAACGWAAALVLAEVNPTREEEIMTRGYEYGQSRVICGYHWQSDVDAARLMASSQIAVLHSNAEFARLMKEAKEEFAKIAK